MQVDSIKDFVVLLVAGVVAGVVIYFVTSPLNQAEKSLGLVA